MKSRCLLCATVLLTLAGCGDQITDPLADDTTAAQVVVDPAAVHMWSGSQLKLAVTPLDANGNRLSPFVTNWTSSNLAVASVGSDGLVQALQPGSTILTATTRGATGTSEVTVEARQLYGLRWTRQLPDTSGARLTAVWGSSETNVFAVGYRTQPSAGGWDEFESVVLHYDGSNWSRMQTPDIGELTDVWGTSESDVFAIGDRQIVHYDGRSWSLMASPAQPGSCFARIWSSSGSDVYVVGAARCDPWGWDEPEEPLVLHYDGRDWQTVTLPVSSSLAGLQGVWGSSASDVFAVGYDLILHYDGKSWSRMGVPIGLTPLHQVWGSSGKDVFAVGTGGTILHYDGQSWSAMPAEMGGGGVISGIWGTSPTDVFAVGIGYGCNLLHYDGTSWVATEMALWMSDIWTRGGSAFAVGPGFTIMHGTR